MVAGIVLGVILYYGIVGPSAVFGHTGIRILLDQIMETNAGTSSMPWAWPIKEQVIDVPHKGVYAVVPGYIYDGMIQGVDWCNG